MPVHWCRCSWVEGLGDYAGMKLEEVKALLRLLREPPDPEMAARLLEIFRRWWVEQKASP